MSNLEEIVYHGPILGQKKGYFIAFEGVDGAGKSHQVDLLRQALQKTGFTVNVFRSPGTTKIGEKIRSITHDVNNKNMSEATELLLMNADRAQLVHESIKPALARGEIVICDRFLHSTIIYQGFGRQIDMTIIKALLQYTVGDVQPDLTFVMDVSPEEAAKRTSKRGTSDRFEQEDSSYQARIRQGFDWLKSMESQSKGKLISINADPSAEDVHNEIYRCVAFRIGQLREGSLEVDSGKKIIT
jgi:dTMP kinase